MQLLRRLKRIKWKSGSGTIYMGVSMMALALVAVLVISEIFNVQYVNARVRLTSDVVADGSAVAANTPAGFKNDTMTVVAGDLITYNDISGLNISYSVYSQDKTPGNSTYKLVTSNVQGTADSIIGASDIHMSGTSVVQVEVNDESAGWLACSFVDNQTQTLPFVTSHGARNPVYVTWLMEHYLVPQYNEIYETGYNGVSMSHKFIYDYLICMGVKVSALPPKTESEWRSYFSDDATMIEDGWEQITSCADAQAAADAGEIVIISQINSAGTHEMYVVVPQTGVVDSGDITVASVGSSGNYGYKRKSWAEITSNAFIYRYTDTGRLTAGMFGSGTMLWPAPSCSVITSSFKYRPQFSRWHYGIDIDGYGYSTGTPIIATADGTVTLAGWNGGYGNCVTITHGIETQGRTAYASNGRSEYTVDSTGATISTVYGHLDSICVSAGQQVTAGTIIGRLGNTGNSFGEHLHYEVRVNGVCVDPVDSGYIGMEFTDASGNTVNVDVIG